MEFYFIFVNLYGCVRLLTQICLLLTTLYRSKDTTPVYKDKRANKRTQSRLIRLIEVVFSKGAMLSVYYSHKHRFIVIWQQKLDYTIQNLGIKKY